jgi:hypothetical protein
MNALTKIKKHINVSIAGIPIVNGGEGDDA